MHEVIKEIGIALAIAIAVWMNAGLIYIAGVAVMRVVDWIKRKRSK